MRSNKASSGRIDGNIAQVGGDVRGDVIFMGLRRGLASWLALGTAVVVGFAVIAVWRFDSLRFKEVRGTARPAFVVASSAKTTTTSPTPTPPSVAPDPQRALAPLDITVQEVVPPTCKHGRVVPPTTAKAIQAPREGGPPGSVLGDGGQVRITVQGRHDTAVLLTSVRVEVLVRRPAMQGLYLQGICGSNHQPRFFDVDLRQRLPQAVPKPGRDGPTEFPAVAFPYKVSATDPEMFIFNGLSPDEDVEWQLHLLWSSAGEMRETRIDNNGKPFRTTSTKATQPWCWTYEGVNGGSGWIPPGSAIEDILCPP